MNSKTTEQFWNCYLKLPPSIKKQAKLAYKQFLNDPFYPSLRFKRVHSTKPIFSIRITKDYRALGILQGNDIIWFWIGSHADYNNLLKLFRKTK